MIGAVSSTLKGYILFELLTHNTDSIPTYIFFHLNFSKNKKETTKTYKHKNSPLKTYSPNI